MKEKIIKSYYDFFDKQIGDSTIVVGVIGIMIFFVGFLSEVKTNNYKSNILEYNKINYDDSIVSISGKKYKVIFEEIK